MITRNPVNQTLAAAKVTLKRKGWTYRAAAKHLGYSYTHFAYVMTGRRSSRVFMQRLAALPSAHQAD